MNEFKEMLKEAFVGEEPYDPSPGREALLASLRKLEGRDRTLRWMMWFAVTFMMAVAVWAGWSFFQAEESDVRELVLYATLFAFACQGIGWAKMFLFTTQKDLSVLKELKRVQMMMLQHQPSGSGRDNG